MFHYDTNSNLRYKDVELTWDQSGEEVFIPLEILNEITVLDLPFIDDRNNEINYDYSEVECKDNVVIFRLPPPRGIISSKLSDFALRIIRNIDEPSKILIEGIGYHSFMFDNDWQGPLSLGTLYKELEKQLSSKKSIEDLHFYDGYSSMEFSMKFDSNIKLNEVYLLINNTLSAAELKAYEIVVEMAIQDLNKFRGY